MDLEIQNAIEIAFDHSSNPDLKRQAYEFLQQLRDNPSAWQICFSLFIRSPSLGEVTRVFSLDIVNHAVQTQKLDPQSLAHIKESLLEYIRRFYGATTPADHNDSISIRNKLAQTFTTLFTVMYPAEWPTFFDHLWEPAQRELQTVSSTHVATTFYLRTLSAVHDEIADILVSNSAEKQKLHTDLKDEIRRLDVSKIATSWQDILNRWQNLDRSTLCSCLSSISRWVSWTEISLVANPAVLSRLFEIATQDPTRSHDVAATAYAAIDVFAEIIAKKMLPGPKIELIQSLNVEAVLSQLVSSPILSDARGSPHYDTDMAEAVARLVNNVVTDIVKVLDGTKVDGPTRERAEQMLRAFTPHLLRFFSDDYDEVCATVIPSLTDLLSLLRKFAKQLQSLPGIYGDMLGPILSAIIAKMRYDDASDWGDEDSETDDAEFQELRKRLRVLQQIVAATNENLFLSIAGDLVASTLSTLQSAGNQLNWRDLDVALMEMNLLGELAIRNGGLYQKRSPTSTASEKFTQLMNTLVESSTASHPHPAIHLQYMELCTRYFSFFEQHPQHIPRVLEYFVAFMHSEQVKVRTRSWHFFLRFVRNLRAHLGNFSETVVRAIGDLLAIKAEVPTDTEEDDMSSNQETTSADALFQSQLFLFEATGCIASAPNVSADTQMAITQAVLTPLVEGLKEHMAQASTGDEKAIFQIHHLMQAIGTLARGFSEWNPEKMQQNILPQITVEFSSASDAILSALGSLKASITVREGARFAFSRLIGVLGFKVAEQLPQWLDGLLAASSTKDEMATFLRLLDQIIFGFKTEIHNVLDALLTPLLSRIFEGFATPPTGTDDELHLGELRKEYLSFLLIVLNNNLDSVLVSPANQPIFDTIIAAIEHFAKDTNEYTDARLAISVFIKMCDVWGGPNVAANSSATPTPSLPGFDGFMLSRLSGITWAILTNPAFDSKDPQANRVVGEIAALQQAILLKTGQAYSTWLRDTELRNLGAQEPAIQEYVQALTSTDAKGFKQYLLRFLQQSRG